MLPTFHSQKSKAFSKSLDKNDIFFYYRKIDRNQPKNQIDSKKNNNNIKKKNSLNLTQTSTTLSIKSYKNYQKSLPKNLEKNNTNNYKNNTKKNLFPKKNEEKDYEKIKTNNLVKIHANKEAIIKKAQITKEINTKEYSFKDFDKIKRTIQYKQAKNTFDICIAEAKRKVEDNQIKLDILNKYVEEKREVIKILDDEDLFEENSFLEEENLDIGDEEEGSYNIALPKTNNFYIKKQSNENVKNKNGRNNF